MLLKAAPVKMPERLMPLPPMSDTGAYKAFEDLLDAEAPYFHWWLDNHDFPACVQQRRFGTVPYKNADLLARIKELGHADEVHFVVQRAIFARNLVVGHDEDDEELRSARVDRSAFGIRLVGMGVVEIETNGLLSLALKKEPERARRLFPSVKSMGMALAEVRRDHPKLYAKRESNGKSYWTVTEDKA